MIDAFSDTPDPELELEGFDVGRGTEVHNAEVRILNAFHVYVFVVYGVLSNFYPNDCVFRIVGLLRSTPLMSKPGISPNFPNVMLKPQL